MLGLMQKIYKMSLEHIIVPESKELLFERKQKTKNNSDSGMSKGRRIQLKVVPWPKLEKLDQ